MELSKQVVSLELAKRLKELGVRQESMFRWDEGEGIEDRLEYMPEYANKTHELISAFTVAELGDILPLNVMLKNCNENGAWFSSHKENGQWSVMYEGCPKKGVAVKDTVGNRIIRRDYAETEADARAKMLIYLLENGLIQNQTCSGK